MRLFICYARVDAYRVRELVDILRQGGHDPWFDYGLLPGQDWQAQLLTQIKASDALVYALSPESVASEWCQWEFAEAIKLGKPVIPILLQENAEPPEVLGRYQWADFTAGPTPEAVARLMGGLAQVTVTIPAEDAPSAPENPSGQPPQIVIHGDYYDQSVKTGDVSATAANIGSGTQTVAGDVAGRDKIARSDGSDAPAVTEPFDIDQAVRTFFEAYDSGKWRLANQWMVRISQSGQTPSFLVFDEYEPTGSTTE